MSAVSCQQLLYRGKVTRNGCFSRQWVQKGELQVQCDNGEGRTHPNCTVHLQYIQDARIPPQPPGSAFREAQAHSPLSYFDSITKKLLLPFPFHVSHKKKPLTCRYVVPSTDLHCPFLIGEADELDTFNSNIYWKDELYLFYNK